MNWFKKILCVCIIGFFIPSIQRELIEEYTCIINECKLKCIKK